MPIIETNNIAKRYIIGRKDSTCDSLRDELVTNVQKPIRWLMGFRETKKDFWALKDISFAVERGEILGIIGANGAGKSTLLKILSRITPPTQGEIIMRGRVASLLEVGTGFHAELSGRENIYLNGAILGMKRSEIQKKFDEIVQFSGVSKFLDTPVKRYSSGMYVRLAFAVAAHLEPDILLVDEVLAVGDAEFQKRSLGKMSEVTKNEGRTIIFVSHNMGAIQNLCGRCMFLDKGEIRSIGPTNEVIGSYLEESRKNIEVSLEDRTDRVGNGEIKVTNFRIIDSKTNSPIGFVASGQDIYLEISYRSKFSQYTDIKNVNFSIVFTNNLGQFVAALNSRMANKEFKFLSNSGKVYCRIPKFSLMPGVFNIKISLEANNTLVDQVENASVIKVETGDFFGTGILNTYERQGVFMDHAWESEAK